MPPRWPRFTSPLVLHGFWTESLVRVSELNVLLADFETDKIAKMIALGEADGLLPPVDLCSYLNLSETRALIHAPCACQFKPLRGV